MMPRIHSLFRYPIKSFSAESLTSVEVMPGRAFPGDRRFALMHSESSFNPQRPAWQRKREFAVLVQNDAIAQFKTAFDPGTGHLRIEHAGTVVFTGDVSTAMGRQQADAAFNAVLKDRRGPLRLVDAGEVALTDQQAPSISFINLASLRELEAKAGALLDPVRFRGNILVEGLAPWAEFAWVGQTVKVGAVEFKITSRIDRCMATAVNPATAQRDIDTLKLLRESYEHIDCGVFGQAVTAGTLHVGDAISTS